MIFPLNWKEPILSSSREINVLVFLELQVCNYWLNIGQVQLNIGLTM